MALRILKKFDELDIKEKILTGRRRNLPARHRKNQRAKSAVPTRRRNDNNGNRSRGRNANHGEKMKRRRPQSAGPVHRRGRSNNRNKIYLSFNKLGSASLPLYPPQVVFFKISGKGYLQ